MKSAADRAIERGLAQGQALGSTPDMSEPGSTCPDDETVAAWADGQLSQHQTALVDSHVAACGYCQSVVAALARAAEAAPPAVGSARPGLATWVWPLATAATLVLAVWGGRVALWPSDTSAPAGAPAQTPPLESVQSRADGPSLVPPQPAAVEAAPAELKKVQEALDRAAVDGAQPPSQLERGVSSSPGDAAVERPAPVAPAERSELATVARDAVSRREANAADVAPGAPATASLDAVGASGPAAVRQDGLLDRRAAVAPSTAPSTARLALETADALVVESPTGGWRWRRAGSRVELTRDGAAWRETDVMPPVAARVLAGHSPSAATCWLVGRGGLVLRTVDGARFEPTTSPSNDDLTVVRSSAADTAEVGTADGRRWRTTDRGRTWTAGPSEPR